jgi:hypothetical protein
MASCNWASSTVRSLTTSTESNSFCWLHRASQPESGPSRQWSWFCRSRPNAESGISGPHPSASTACCQFACDVELVVARKDDAGDLLLVVLLRNQVAGLGSPARNRAARPAPTNKPSCAVGFTGLPAAPWSPRLNGRKKVAGPAAWSSSSLRNC